VYARVVAPPGATGRAGGYGPFFGVVPEFGESQRPGVRVGGVRAGSPAERAGVRQGDVIVAFGGLTVRTLEDFTFALRARRPGDRVEVVVQRDGGEQRVEAVLEERR
jgi:S1-C subfamily serine protease